MQHALATPLSWAVLEFEQRKPPVDKCETWLKWSKDFLLDIIIGPQPFKASSINHAKTILRLTEPHLERWRSISTHALPDKILRMIFDRIGLDGLGRLDRLETMKVAQVYRRYSRDPMRIRRRFKPFANTDEGLPGLRNLILEGHDAQYFSGRFRLFQVWRIINPFVDTNRGVHNFHDFLSALPDLRVLHVCDFRFFRHSIETEDAELILLSSIPVLTHHALTELSLHSGLTARKAILSSLVLPNLLYPLDLRSAEPAIGVSCLSHLAQKYPFPQLVSLRLVGNDGSQPAWHPLEVNATYFEEALAGLPELKALTFNSVDFGRLGGQGSYLACLGRTCPRLRGLVLVECQDTRSKVWCRS
ncbi:hypothetical protein M407DRAFT_29544 [Tulasnella calospora MUT 4182]|uniref:F-box domain-containing protein n=1 Tax=Tulasnella calospora MUT 4182 TaxID=1051891 RepID=A0A0C3Q8U4_9AGAM|nr:hypothetical protein M407DRAFT_29544 [Tulasnella calospora MUT 4182]